MSRLLSKLLPFAVMAAFLPSLAVMAVKEPRELLAAWLIVNLLAVFAEYIFTGFGRPLFQLIGRMVLRPKDDERPPVDWRLPTHSTVWNLLVYGLSATVTFPIVDWWHPGYYSWPLPLRGSVGMLVIYAWEYGWGMTIKHLTGRWPWEYRYPFKFFEKFTLTRIVNPLYAPFWFFFGLALEKIHLYVVPSAFSFIEAVLKHRPWQLTP